MTLSLFTHLQNRNNRGTYHIRNKYNIGCQLYLQKEEEGAREREREPTSQGRREANIS